MAKENKTIGRVPVSRHEYTDGATYYKDNIVTRYGSAFQCVVDSTTTPPATLDESGSVVLGEGWIFFADTSKISNAVAEHTKKISKIEQLLQEGYTFMGVATPETNPGTPDRKVFYIANGKGKYEKFGGLEVTEDEVVILYYDTAWHKVATGIASNEKFTELEKLKKTVNKQLISPESLVWLNNTTIDAVTGKVVKGSGYSSTQLIQIYNGKFTLYNNGRPTTSLLAGFMAYWGESGNLIGVERNNINQALIAQSSYVQFSVHIVDNTALALYTIDNGSGELEKEVKEAKGNISNIFANIYDITKTTINTTNVSWIVGGFDVSKNDFNDASNYVHSSPVLLSGTLRLSMRARFIVYYDISGNIVDYEENVDIPTKAGSYPYCSVVILATAQDGFMIGNNIASSEQKIENNTKRITELEKAGSSLLAPTISWTIGENIDSEGQVITDSRYSRTDIIKVKGAAFKLLYFGIPTTNLLAGFMAYYDDQMNLLGCERSTINSALLAQSSYIQFSVYKNDKYDLSQYSIITGEDLIAQFKKEEDLRNTINGYRYLVATFGVAGLKNNPATNALTILGSNDLLHFKTISRHLAFAPTKCKGVRDPSIIKIEDYYYIAYTNGVYLNVTNEIGMCRTKDFVTYEELDNLVLEGANGENFSNGYVWAPAWFKENDNYYLIVGCSETTGNDSQPQDFWHYIFDYDVENHSVSKGFKTNVFFIDGHIYKQNGNYYLLGSSFRLWKSSTLKSTSWVEISPYLMAHIEGQFAIRKDDGTLRIFAQKVPYTKDGVSYPDSHYYYLDGGTDLENGFDLSTLAQIKLNPDDVVWAHYAQGNNAHEFWHFTVYDRNCFLDNNENYQD